MKHLVTSMSGVRSMLVEDGTALMEWRLQAELAKERSTEVGTWSCVFSDYRIWPGGGDREVAA